MFENDPEDIAQQLQQISAELARKGYYQYATTLHEANVMLMGLQEKASVVDYSTSMLKSIHKASESGTMFRPISWRGSGCVLKLEDGYAYIPTAMGDRLSLMPHTQDLLNEWETVDTNTIQKELAQIMLHG